MISSAPSPTSINLSTHNMSLNPLLKLGSIVRLSCLSLLSAGSAAIVFAAITLVKAGEARGLTVFQAASANAPLFIQFGKVAAAACVALLIAEAVDSFFSKQLNRLKLTQYAASFLCCLCGFTFAFFIAPVMEHLLPYINYDAQMNESFHKLHQSSRLLFSGVILFAWISLILPIFASSTSDSNS